MRVVVLGYDVSMHSRVAIFVDGGNFYHLVLKKLGVREENFDFEKFVLFLAKGRTIVSKRYYVGTVREKTGDLRSREAMSRQTKLFTSLTKNGWEVQTSKLRSRIEEVTIDQRVNDWKKLRALGIEKISFERSREKGIDVQIATDILLLALEDSYDVAQVSREGNETITRRPAWVRSCGSSLFLVEEICVLHS